MAYSFISFIRQGIANSIKSIPDPSKGSTPINTGLPRAAIEVTVNVQFNNSTTTEPLPKKKLELYGPGDVIGIDKRAIIRTEPQHYNTTFEPKHLAFIEFYDEDFPWRFTPTAANEDNRKLSPWLALVVLENAEFTENPTTPGDEQPLPSFLLKDDTDRLKIFPATTNLWAWSHVHINEDVVKKEVAGGVLNDNAVKTNIKNVLDSDGDYCYSRIICPRRLAANKSYHSFLIPAFETGRLAGLGKFSDLKKTPVTQSAWGTYDQKEFPYYHRWYFKTGPLGDFEYLVDQLRPRVSDSKVGFREIYVEGIQENAKLKPLYMPGALRVPLDTLEPAKREEIKNYEQWEGATDPHNWQRAIANKLRINLSEDEPGITLPVYGQWHANAEEILYQKGTDNLLPESKRKDWIHELNLDPRYRVIAALGTKVIQQNQEEFMDAAWEQVEKIREANQTIRNYQLAIEVDKAFQKNVINSFSNEQLLSFTSPLHKKINSGATSSTLFKYIDESPVANGIATNVFRKMARNSGRVSTIGKNKTHAFANTGKDINSKFNTAKYKDSSAGVISMERFEAVLTNYITTHPVFTSASVEDRNKMNGSVRESIRYSSNTTERLKNPNTAYVYSPVGSLFTPLTRNKTIAPASATVQSTGAWLLGNAIENTKKIFEQLNQIKVKPKIPLDLSESSRSILKGINATVNLGSRFAKQYPHLADQIHMGTDLQNPIMTYPEFDLPMYILLNDLSNEYFLPNINLLEQNSITFLETNQRFIEAYMVGLNHEMSRELLWRGFPTDQRGTYFKNFWDSMDEGYQGIKEIHTWSGKLGENSLTDNSGLLFLVIRGDLLNKYPNTVVTLQKADWGPPTGSKSVSADRIIKPGTTPVLPQFEAKIDPDIYFLAFRIIENGKVLSENDLAGATNPVSTTDNPGWFFVFQERPGEPRFGLDINQTTIKRRWSDISWSDTGVAEKSILNFERPITVTSDIQATWPPQDSAQLAYILYQQPVLVAIHASRLLINQI